MNSKIYDCFMFNNEVELLNIRLNILDQYVDHFVIIESAETHSGIKKKLTFDIEKFPKFRDKIIYGVIEKFPKKFSAWEKENYQRNFISQFLNKADDDDFIIISDLDEIPNPKKLQNIYNKKYSVFNQSVFYYKFNLKNISEINWYGTRCCKKKYLISPQKLRNEKIKNYPFWRLDKIYHKKFNIIEDGGWHFCNLKEPEQILYKYKNLCETNDPYVFKEKIDEKFLNLDEIKKKVKSGEDIIGREENYNPIILDNRFPDYIIKNVNNLKKWIVD